MVPAAGTARRDLDHLDANIGDLLRREPDAVVTDLRRVEASGPQRRRGESGRGRRVGAGGERYERQHSDRGANDMCAVDLHVVLLQDVCGTKRWPGAAVCRPRCSGFDV